MSAQHYFDARNPHDYLRLETHAVGTDERHSGRHKGTHYRCRTCLFAFVHWYALVPDIDKAARDAGEPKTCDVGAVVATTTPCIVCDSTPTVADRLLGDLCPL
jgi:hypothetical protein